ncbi:MAG: tRNA lysidine(34) synthetase TilS [Acidobacteria bacterium]|nr:tRNA lysidine(34) synthetase TilS [Acidobacteriota bacterium]
MDVVGKGDERTGERKERRRSVFAKRLFAEWKRLGLPTKNERIVVAVSGGADSIALLLGLDELSKAGRLALEVTVAHLDHGLRGEASEADAQWVAEMATGLGYEAALGRASVKGNAEESGDNLEQAARRARYQFLARVALERKVHIVLAAHTMDDQAETVLLRLLRGSGAEGLSGIEAVRKLFEEKDVLLARPLLYWARRAETEEYCRERNVAARVDAMNMDERFARVRVRKHLLPLMQTFNGRVVEALARTAQLLREDASALEIVSAELLIAASEDGARAVSPLRVEVLRCAPVAVRRRALRQWIARGRGHLRRIEMAHLLAVESLLVGELGGRMIELPGGARVSRKRGLIYFDLKRVVKGDDAV